MKEVVGRSGHLLPQGRVRAARRAAGAGCLQQGHRHGVGLQLPPHARARTSSRTTPASRPRPTSPRRSRAIRASSRARCSTPARWCRARRNVAWWAPRGATPRQAARDERYPAGARPLLLSGRPIRVTMNRRPRRLPVRKPTPFDGMMFGEWVANATAGRSASPAAAPPSGRAGSPARPGSDVENLRGSAPPAPRVSGGSGDGGPAPMTSGGDSSPQTGTSSSGAVSAGPPPPTGPVSAGPPPPSPRR